MEDQLEKLPQDIKENDKEENHYREKNNHAKVKQRYNIEIIRLPEFFLKNEKERKISLS